MEHGNRITYIANAGVMIEVNGKKILIDALNNDKIPLYKTPTDEAREMIIQGKPPFDNIDVMLFTHHHSDHFDTDSTIEFIKHNRHTFILSTGETISKIESQLSLLNDGTTNDLENIRLVQLNPALHKAESFNVNGINLQAISMLHEGKEYEAVQNLAYLIDVQGTTLLHVGDAKPYDGNFAHHNFIEENIDALIAPFSYVGILPGRRVINEHIKPHKIATVHLPYKEADAFGWIDATKRSYNRVKATFTDTVFFEEPGTMIHL